MSLSENRRILDIENDHHVIMILAYLLTYEYRKPGVFYERGVTRQGGPHLSTLWEATENSPLLIFFKSAICVDERKYTQSSSAEQAKITASVRIRTNLDPCYVKLLQKFVTTCDYFNMELINPPSTHVAPQRRSLLSSIVSRRRVPIILPWEAPKPWRICFPSKDSQISTLTLNKAELSQLKTILEKYTNGKFLLDINQPENILKLIAYILTFNFFQENKKINLTFAQLEGDSNYAAYSRIFMNSMSILGIVIEPFTVINISMCLKYKKVITSFPTTRYTDEQQIAYHAPEIPMAESYAAAAMPLPIHIPAPPPVTISNLRPPASEEFMLDGIETAIILNEYFWQVNKNIAEKILNPFPFIIPKELFSNYWPGYIMSSEDFLSYILFPVEQSILITVKRNYREYATAVLNNILGATEIFSSAPLSAFIFAPSFNYVDSKKQIEMQMRDLGRNYQLTPQLPIMNSNSGTIITTLNQQQLNHLLIHLKNNDGKLTKRRL